VWIVCGFSGIRGARRVRLDGGAGVHVGKRELGLSALLRLAHSIANQGETLGSHSKLKYRAHGEHRPPAPRTPRIVIYANPRCESFAAERSSKTFASMLVVVFAFLSV